MDPATILGLSYVGKETVAIVGDFVKRVLGPTLDAAGDGLAAPWQEWARRRHERAKQTVIEAALVLDATKELPQTVPGRVLFPILEHSSVEEDDDLHMRWVSLLASASATPDKIPPSFPAVLAQLSRNDARLLDWLWAESIPQVDSVHPDGLTVGRLFRNSGMQSGEFNLSFANLYRLNLIAAGNMSSTLFTDASSRTSLYINITPFAQEFVAACRRGHAK